MLDITIISILLILNLILIWNIRKIFKLILTYSDKLYVNYKLIEGLYHKRRKEELIEEVSHKDSVFYIDELEEMACYGEDFLEEVLNYKG
ncbi:MAG: hypothetical protein ACLU4S_02570 [Clostridium perfringens]